jgi:hypothetical protein
MSQATCRAQYINKNNLTFFTSPVFIDQEGRMCSVHIYYLHERSYVPAVDVSCRDFISHGKVQALNLYPCIFLSWPSQLITGMKREIENYIYSGGVQDAASSPKAVPPPL